MLINRSGALFEWVLHSLCTGTFQCPSHIHASIMLREMEYYEVTPNLSGAKMRGVCLKGAVLEGCNMSLADLSGADLSRASLASSDLTNANLSDQSHVISARTHSHTQTIPPTHFLSPHSLFRCQSHSLQPHHTYLSRANLTNAVMCGTTLSGCDLSLLRSFLNFFLRNLPLMSLYNSTFMLCCAVLCCSDEHQRRLHVSETH